MGLIGPTQTNTNYPALLIQALDSLAEKNLSKRPDILHRVDEVMMKGKFHTMECGAPWLLARSSCCGDARVDFIEMATRGDLAAFREWIISGLCMRCQDRVFGRGAEQLAPRSVVVEV